MKFSEKFRMQAAALSSLHPFTIFDVGNSAARREGGDRRGRARATGLALGSCLGGSGMALVQQLALTLCKVRFRARQSGNLGDLRMG